jgi:uncharacterized protein (TIGR03083 family)
VPLVDLTIDVTTASATIDAAGAALTGAGRAAPDEAVATCPGWTVATLVKHVGLVHTWAAATVRQGGSEPVTFPKAPAGISGGELADWADQQRAGLLTALIETDPERPTWFFGEVRPARTWRRRQTHETTVHAWDATAAQGSPWPIPSDIAADGVDELLGWFLPRRWSEHPPEWGAGRTVHFHRTDGEGEWLLTLGATPALARGHAKGDLAVRGPAPELLLWGMNRPADVELFGDLELAAGWAAHVAV